MRGVTCHHFRELVSTRIDGELDAQRTCSLDRHLAECAACRQFEEQSFALRRSLTIAPVDAPERSALVVRALPPIRAASALQLLLFVIGVTLIVVNVPSVVLPDASSAAHLDRHGGVFGSALGVGMLAVAVKPQRAIGLVPLTSAITVLMAVVAVADLAADRTSFVSEAVHVVEFAGLLCLWVISGGAFRLRARMQAMAGWPRRPTVPSWPMS